MSSEVTALRNFSEIEPEVVKYLRNVYLVIALAIISTAAGAYFPIFEGIYMGVVCLLVILLMLVMIIAVPQPHTYTRFTCLMILAYFLGVDMISLIRLATAVDTTIVPTAAVITALCFFSFSLAATVGDTRAFLMLGGFLMATLLCEMLLVIVAIIFKSPVLYMWALHLTVVVSCLFIVYDTQLIIHRRRQGDSDCILHSLLLFIDIIDLLRVLILILIISSKDIIQKVSASISRRN